MGNTVRKEVSMMQTALRYWEYYGMTDTFTDLYNRSKDGDSFKNLYDLIIDERNILLAYRSIKSNKGSKTAGTDGYSIGRYKSISKEEFIEYIRKKLVNYSPHKVRRVFIPKQNGDLRPLGIPTMIDRLIQQMFKQVLEPIAEAKFYEHSYGFRPLRRASHPKARCEFLTNRAHLHYMVDIDIKGFFDNVNHTKLMKQMWNMGIQDRKVLAIFMKMLKAPIDRSGKPTKGTPQGGILSPLLSNIVLNDLDQWVAGQWGKFPLGEHQENFRMRYKAQYRTNLKRGFIVRYADDFKIFCKDSKTAWKWYHAVKLYLKDRLGLDVSPEKSKVVNLRKNYTEFLGFKIKLFLKEGKWVALSWIKDKKIEQIKREARELIKKIQKKPNFKTASDYNSFVLGVHNYFKVATHAYKSLNRVSYDLSRLMHNRLKEVAIYEYPGNPSQTYLKYFGKFKRKTYRIQNRIDLYPIVGVQRVNNMNFTQSFTPFTPEGRELIHKKLDPVIEQEIMKLMRSNIHKRSMEYMDNRISRYSMRRGRCEILGYFLTAGEVHCHHYLPLSLNGDDSFANLRIVHEYIHRLVHATDNDTIEKYRSMFTLTK
jgi:RNA-directed DNA polymerase